MLATELLHHRGIYSTIVASVAFSPDGQLLASGGHNAKIHLWDPITGQRLRTLAIEAKTIWSALNSAVFSVAFSPDGNLLATADSYAARLWDPATGEQLGVLTDHTNVVESVAFGPDGQLLASASNDKTVRLWDPATGQQLGVLTGHTSVIQSVAFSPDGQLLASAGMGSDKTVRMWDPATGRQLRTFLVTMSSRWHSARTDSCSLADAKMAECGFGAESGNSCDRAASLNALHDPICRSTFCDRNILG
jgi:WD40 repeat protein